MTKLLPADTRLSDTLQDLYQASFSQDQALAFLAGRISISSEEPERARVYLYYVSEERLAQLRAQGLMWQPTEIEARVTPGLWSRLQQDPVLAEAKLAQLRLTFRTDTSGVVSWTLTDLKPLPPTGDAIFPDWVNVQGQILMVGCRYLVVRIHSTSVLPFTLRVSHDGDIFFDRRQRRWCFRLQLHKGKLRVHTAIPIGKPLPETWAPKPRRPKLRKAGKGPLKAAAPSRSARPAVPAR